MTGDGWPAIGRCAMTKAYTVVIKEEHTGIYGIFVDDRLCYIVENPSSRFYNDLKNHSMCSYSEAEKFY